MLFLYVALHHHLRRKKTRSYIKEKIYFGFSLLFLSTRIHWAISCIAKKIRRKMHVSVEQSEEIDSTLLRKSNVVIFRNSNVTRFPSLFKSQQIYI